MKESQIVIRIATFIKKKVKLQKWKFSLRYSHPLKKRRKKITHMFYRHFQPKRLDEALVIRRKQTEKQKARAAKLSRLVGYLD